MPKVFLSHSSKDKRLAARIARDLESYSIGVWFDDQEMKVGDSITGRVQQGLHEADFVVVLLTRNSLESGWVEKEWQSKIGHEAAQRSVKVLPVKGDDCEVPLLLQDRLCVELKRDYHDGIKKLVKSIYGSSVPTARRAPPDDATLDFKLDSNVITEVGTCEIELILPQDISQFTPEKQRSLLAAISQLLEVREELTIKRKRPGSTILTLELPMHLADRLLWSVKGGALDEHGVVDAKLLDPPSHESAEARRSRPVTVVSLSRRRGSPLQGAERPHSERGMAIPGRDLAGLVTRILREMDTIGLRAVPQQNPGLAGGPVLALVVYCYAIGVFSSSDIQSMLEAEGATGAFGGLKLPDAHTIRRFRRNNHAIIRSCLERLFSELWPAGDLESAEWIRGEAQTRVERAMFLDMMEVG